ncbi:4a-hydroxytetrahydrobiopterin dehydratase [Sphingobacterium oryzagri]|uniref:4a-hydroxytetrahydrobiopterin dehydratase n=1 Tax=Sphingobacterium oryzagri TaxID=3025669 RepID=A0ABY7WCA1_9SPHI|nr:4a-hydroxytetrahydrobiopterin dehydratase [Sphingobacterium sp. KACC 22765]WDF67291.1 4a-hydroxytetrahydrobiopterin dehydratase [Sphingobacterium sp. KACC 22765]
MRDHVSSVWKEIDNRLYQKFKFTDFSTAFAFMTQVALLAEAQQHHPLWKNVYNEVEIWLSTHDAGNKVTQKDRQLAESIDQIFLR